MIETGLKEQLPYLKEELSTMREAGPREQLSDLNEELSTMRVWSKGTAVLPQ